MPTQGFNIKSILTGMALTSEDGGGGADDSCGGGGGAPERVFGVPYPAEDYHGP